VEARAPFRAASVSKTFVAAILVIVALGLAAMGGYVVKSLSGAPASQTQNYVQRFAPGTVLRQDWQAAPSGTHSGYRGGLQPIVDVAGTAPSNPGYDARTVREGHGA
jgi:hypothetical protein